MKNFNLGPGSLLLSILFIWISATTEVRAISLTINQVTEASITATFESRNNLVTASRSYVKWYVNGVHVATSDEVFQRDISVSHTFSFSASAPGSTQEIKAYAMHADCCFWYQGPTYTETRTLPIPVPVTNVRASKGLYQSKVVVEWDVNEVFDNHGYILYFNGNYLGQTGKGTNSFTHENLSPGQSYFYTVRGNVNGYWMDTPPGNQGNTFFMNLTATDDEVNNVVLNWNSFSGTSGATGYSVERRSVANNQYSEISSSGSTSSTSYSDASNDLIPGYLYDYRVRVNPTNVSDVVAETQGRKRANGTISGRITTPPTFTNPNGVGVSNVDITVNLVGNPLPTSNVTTYTTKTGPDGNYQINNIYYYTEAQFEVTPSLVGHQFENESETVTLKLDEISQTVNFTDVSSFIISGTVVQAMSEGVSCPMPGVRIALTGSSDEYVTDSLGRYDIVVPSGGGYKLTPILGDHVFEPAEVDVNITGNTSGINFTDNTKTTLEGTFAASCNSYAGVATLRFYTLDNCFSTEVTTQANTGNYSIELPAREYKVEVKEFVSFDTNILDPVDVLAYFFEPATVNLTLNDTLALNDSLAGSGKILDFVYRTTPTLQMEGIFNEFTCDDNPIPILEQHGEYILSLRAIEEFNGNTCPAGPGFIVINQNITVNGTSLMTDTLYYNSGDTLKIRFVPGTPNRIAPHKKFIEATLHTEGYVDQILHDVIVTGHSPREQTFTTVTPEIPFHVLYNPPGDNSYSYLQTGQTVSNTVSFSYETEDELEGFVRAQLLPTVGLSFGPIGITLEAQLDITYAQSSGSSETTSDAVTISTTATERFQTSANVNITGDYGDVFVGGALNMLYGNTDIVLYNRDACSIELSTKMVVSPEKFETTFIYTSGHVKDVLIPSLTRMRDYYLNLQSDSAVFYTDQISVWNQVLDNHADNIANANFVENISFSGGTSVEKSLESTQTRSNSIEFNWYINEEVATEFGAAFAGQGVFGGVAVRGKIGGGEATQTDSTTTTTVGYVLSDDDLGDSFTVDVLECDVYATPAFKLVSGETSCPWEPGTLPREGVQLLANTYVQEVELSEQATFILQLGNLSQSEETRTYDLIFDHTTNPNGAILTIGGSPIVGGIPYSYTIQPGGGTNATITVRKGPDFKDYEGLKFILKSQCDDQISEAIYLSVYFHELFDLTIETNGNGNVNVAPGVYTHKEGTVVNLFASPAQGYVFDKWVINGEEIFRQAVPVEVNSNTTATAYFVETTEIQHTLTVEVSGNGTANYPVGSHYFTTGSIIELSAIPDADYGFLKWEIDGVDVMDIETSFTITRNMTVKLHFIKVHMFTLNINGNGTTNLTPDTYFWNEGTEVSLFASPDLGYVFSKWIVNGEELFTQSISFTLSQVYDVTAVFTETYDIQYTLTMGVEGEGQTMPPAGVHVFTSGQTISLSATPEPGQMLEKWIIGGAENTNNPVNVTLTADVAVMAYFAVDDVAPVPDNAELADVTAECEVTTLVAPNATDNAVGNVTGTHDAVLPITTQGTTVVTWTYDDGNGNTTTQTQNVVIEDVTPPSLMCNENVTISIEAGETSYTIMGSGMDLVDYSDNCGVKSITNSLTNTSTLNEAVLQVGQNIIEWKVIDINDLESTCSIEVTVNVLVSTNDIVEQGIHLFPNPTSGMVQVKSDQSIHVIEIFDVTGKLVHVKTYQPQKSPVIDISSLQNGVYFLNIKYETGGSKHRIIKN
jgi:hypothetical protein